MHYCPFRHFRQPCIATQLTFVRLACLIHAANVRSEPGSNPSKVLASSRRARARRTGPASKEPITPPADAPPRQAGGRKPRAEELEVAVFGRLKELGRQRSSRCRRRGLRSASTAYRTPA